MQRKYSLHSVAEDSGCICSSIIIMHLTIAQAGHFIHYQPSLKAGLFSTCMFQDDEVFLKDRKLPPPPSTGKELAHGIGSKSLFNTSQFSATGHILVRAKLHPTVVTTCRLPGSFHYCPFTTFLLHIQGTCTNLCALSCAIIFRERSSIRK